ncbi:MAG: hypothetical protein ACP5MG_09465 [Verrucomicrobiia bacterium]
MNNYQSLPIERRSVIDVGTNSVKVLVADLKGGDVIPVEERAIQTRLGDGFHNGNELQKHSIEKTVDAIKKFVLLSKSLGASRIRIIATSAVREGINSNKLKQIVREKLGLEMEIISGEREAELVFEGIVDHISDASNERILIADIGGGSSEFIYGIGKRIEFVRSYPFGTVKYLNSCRVSDPPLESEYLHCRKRINDDLSNSIVNDLKNLVSFVGKGIDKFIATGGTITILGRIVLHNDEFIRERLENLKINYEEIKNICDNLWTLPLKDRETIQGIPPDRADVILFGALMYEVIMKNLCLDSVYVSTKGLRFGAIKKN